MTELPWQEAYGISIQVGVASVAIIFVLAALAAIAGVLLARRLAVPLTDLTSTASADRSRRSEAESPSQGRA